MLEWLKAILGEHYSEEVDKKVSDEIGKGFISRTDFNSLNESKKVLEKQVADRDGQLETLKASNGDTGVLKKQIEDLQAQNAAEKADYEAKLKQQEIDNAVTLALTGAKAKNVTAVKALLKIDAEKAEFDEKGVLKGLDEQIKGLKEAQDTGFLFEPEKAAPKLQGFKPGEKRDGLPILENAPGNLAEAVQMALQPTE